MDALKSYKATSTLQIAANEVRWATPCNFIMTLFWCQYITFLATEKIKPPACFHLCTGHSSIACNFYMIWQSRISRSSDLCHMFEWHPMLFVLSCHLRSGSTSKSIPSTWYIVFHSEEFPDLLFQGVLASISHMAFQRLNI